MQTNNQLMKELLDYLIPQKSLKRQIVYINGSF